MKKHLTAIIEREVDGYVALCPELDIASQGSTVEEARDNLREALELFFETASPQEIEERLSEEVYVTHLEIAVGSDCMAHSDGFSSPSAPGNVKTGNQFPCVNSHREHKAGLLSPERLHEKQESGMGYWLRMDEASDAVFSLETVCDQLSRVEDPRHWKWVVIALHSALQGFMVLALKGTHGLNVVHENRKKAWKAVLTGESNGPVDRMLDDFMKLYGKIQKGRDHFEEQIETGSHVPRTKEDLMLMFVGSEPFKPEGTQTKSVEMLNELRNEFIHFFPKIWFEGVYDFPDMVKDCVDVIEFLAFKSGNVLWYPRELEGETRKVIEQIRALVLKTSGLCSVEEAK